MAYQTFLQQRPFQLRTAEDGRVYVCTMGANGEVMETSQMFDDRSGAVRHCGDMLERFRSVLEAAPRVGIITPTDFINDCTK